MAKFRKNHEGGSPGKGVFGKSAILTVLIAVAYFFFNGELPSMEGTDTNSEPDKEVVVIDPSTQNPTKETNKPTDPREDNGSSDTELGAEFDAFKELLPKSKSGLQPVAHETYALGYDEEHEQAAWVAFELNRDYISGKAKRRDAFKADPRVTTKSAHADDYRRSGYSRGHLVAAADRSGKQSWMDETFYMSNMSPQAYNMNGGIWRELEELVRNWAWYYRDLYVVTGPDLENIGSKKIGKYNEITVPDYFYKVIYAPKAKGIKAIGFYIPNEKSDRPLKAFAMTIDEIEEKTNLDFFPSLSDNLEAKVESHKDFSDWKFDDKKYRKRIEVWNNY